MILLYFLQLVADIIVHIERLVAGGYLLFGFRLMLELSLDL